jgi:hypothetical protein
MTTQRTPRNKWTSVLRLAALLSFVSATGCGAEPDQVSNAETVGTTSQAVSWTISSGLLHEHHTWHSGGRSPTEQGKDFLVFHRNFLAKMAREGRALGLGRALMMPWTAVPAELKQSRYGWTTALQNAETRISTNNPPFANENELGTFIETGIHGFLHNAAGRHFAEPDLLDAEVAPRSTIFFQIHGLVDYWWSRFLGRRALHVASTSNIFGHWTELSHTLLNNRPFARILVTQNWRTSGPYNNAHVGVWYNFDTGRWAIFNEGSQAMPVGAAFNVQIEGGQVSATAYSQNRTGNVMYLEHPRLNGFPFASASVTHNWSPLQAANVYNNHASGVYYASNLRWAVFNQDIAEMAHDTSWNVLEGAPRNSTGGATTLLHVTSSSNTAFHITMLSHPALDGNSQARIIVTPLWNPGGLGGVYNNHPIGVYYTGSQWAIFNQDLGTMPFDTGFNVVIQ